MDLVFLILQNIFLKNMNHKILIFQPVFKYFKTPTYSSMDMKSKGLSIESIKPAISDNSLNRRLDCSNNPTF